MAYPMKRLRFSTTTALGYKVMLVGLVVGNQPTTQRADSRRGIFMPGDNVLLRLSRQFLETSTAPCSLAHQSSLSGRRRLSASLSMISGMIRTS